VITPRFAPVVGPGILVAAAATDASGTVESDLGVLNLQTTV
jgi:hypothetical protein